MTVLAIALSDRVVVDLAVVEVGAVATAAGTYFVASFAGVGEGGNESVDNRGARGTHRNGQARVEWWVAMSIDVSDR